MKTIATIVLMWLIVLTVNAQDLQPFQTTGTNIKYGYKDINGKEVIPPIYDSASEFKDGFGIVRLDGKSRYIDGKGNLIFSMKFESAQAFSEGLASVRINGRWGFIDTTGKFVIPAQYGDAGDFRDGKAKVSVNGKEILIHRNDPSTYDNTTTLQKSCSIDFFDKLASAVINKDVNSAKKAAKISLSLTEFKDNPRNSISRTVSSVGLDNDGTRNFVILKYDNGEIKVTRVMTQEEYNFTRQELKKAQVANKRWLYLGKQPKGEEVWAKGDVLFSFYPNPREEGGGFHTVIDYFDFPPINKRQGSN